MSFVENFRSITDLKDLNGSIVCCCHNTTLPKRFGFSQKKIQRMQSVSSYTTTTTTTTTTRWYLLVLCMLVVAQPIKATVYEVFHRDGSKESHPYPSLAAAFGMPWEGGHSYQAEVRYLPENPYLCRNSTTTNNNSTTSAAAAAAAAPMLRGHNHRPVALLAADGECSMEEKVRTAEATSPAVGFLIVYTNSNDPLIVQSKCYYPSNNKNNNNNTASSSSHHHYESECLSDTLVRITSVTLLTGRALMRYADMDSHLETGSLVFMDSVPPKGYKQKIIYNNNNKQMDPDAFPEKEADLFDLYNDDGMFNFHDDDDDDALLIHHRGSRRSNNLSAGLFLMAAFCSTFLILFVRSLHRHHVHLAERRERRYERRQERRRRRQLRRLQRELRHRARFLAARPVVATTTTAELPRRVLTQDQALSFTVTNTDEFVVAHNNNNSNNNHPEDEEDGGDSCSDEIRLLNCAICIESLDYFSNETVEKFTKLPCGHLYHANCILPWLTERQGTCPLCKFNIVEFLLQEYSTTSQQQQQQHPTTTTTTTTTTINPVSHDVSSEDTDPWALFPSPWAALGGNGDDDDDGNNDDDEEEDEDSAGSDMPELEMVETRPSSSSFYNDDALPNEIS